MTRVRTISLTITPISDGGKNLVALSIRMTIEHPCLDDGSVLIQIPTKIDNVPTVDYRAGDLVVSDDAGPLPLKFIDAPTKQWMVTRSTHGNVDVHFLAKPRHVDSTTPVGPRVDLRFDQGGIVGVGKTFLPIPPESGRRHRLVVRWDLSQHPQGSTRAIWTFGEGPRLIERLGGVDVLTNSVYFVGHVKSEEQSDHFGIYWFGSLPANMTDFGYMTESFYHQVAAFAGDETMDPYRIFVRRATPARGFGGTAMMQSCVLEYDAYVSDYTIEYIRDLLCHEMLHNWLLIDDETDSVFVDDNGWYTEGVANLYAGLLPFRFGYHTRSELIENINRQLTGYYTSPVIRMSNREAQKLAWTNLHALRIPYTRGFVYLLKINVEIQAASNGTRSLDDLVRILASMRRRGEPCGIHQWLNLLATEISRDTAVDEFESMQNGIPLSLPTDCLDTEVLVLVRHDKEILDFGIDEESFRTKVVTGITVGSRAAQCGLRERDVILSNTAPWQCADHFEANMRITVQRSGQEFHFEYWPRGWKKTESWEFVAK